MDPSLAPTLQHQLRTISDAGIKSVHSAVPAAMSAPEYAARWRNTD